MKDLKSGKLIILPSKLRNNRKVKAKPSQQLVKRPNSYFENTVTKVIKTKKGKVVKRFTIPSPATYLFETPLGLIKSKVAKDNKGWYATKDGSYIKNTPCVKTKREEPIIGTYVNDPYNGNNAPTKEKMKTKFKKVRVKGEWIKITIPKVKTIYNVYVAPKKTKIKKSIKDQIDELINKTRRTWYNRSQQPQNLLLQLRLQTE